MSKSSKEEAPGADTPSRRALFKTAAAIGLAGSATALLSSGAQAGGGTMMLATTKVEDYERFLKVFSTKGLEKHKQHGCKGAVVFRDPNEVDRVWVMFDWDDTGWKSYVSDPEVPPILKEAGHTGKPQIASLGGQYGA